MRTRQQQVEWLAGRLAGMVDLDQVDVASQQTRQGWHRTGHRVTVRTVGYLITGTVLDADALTTRALAGIGRDKTWGCGLSVWEAA